MTTVSELIRSRAVQISEIRRTGSQDLASKLLRDLFLIAEGVEVGTPVPQIADLLSDGLGIPEPAPRLDVCTFPYLATFIGQAWFQDNAIPVDDGRHSYPVSESEAREAARVEYPADLVDAVEFDALHEAAAAPAEVKNWSGPFDISIQRRAYRIESDHEGSVPLYADTIEQVRAILVELFEEDAQAHEVTVARPLLAQIAGLTEEHLEAPGSAVRLQGEGFEQVVRAQVQDLEYLPDAEPPFSN